MGPVHLERPVGLEEWPQRLRAQRLWPGSDRHPPQPAVWCPQVHSAIAPVEMHAADGAHTRCQRRCRVSGGCDEPKAKRVSFHSDFNAWKAANPDKPTSANPFCNPISKRGPMEGRPPGELFAHQRWDEFFPKVGYVMSLGEIDAGYRPPPVDALPATQQHVDLRRGQERARLGAAAADQGPLRRAVVGARLQRSEGFELPEQGPGLEPWLRSRRNISCISITPTTARKATAPPTCITSPAPFMTIAGARRWRGATRSTRMPPSRRPPGPTATVA